MFETIMVGVDEKTRGRDALALAMALRPAAGSDVVLAHIHARYPGSAKGLTLELDMAERERAAALLAEVRDAAGTDVRVRTIGSGSIGAGLHHLAEVDHADLLVVGSTRGGALRHVFAGDGTRQVVNGAPCAVAVAPLDYAAPPAGISRIGVAFDGSPESLGAIEASRAVAAEHGASLSAFTAIAPPGLTDAAVWGNTPEQAAQMLRDARRRLEELGGMEVQAAIGDVAETLAGFARSVDLLVVGSRGYGPVGRLVHGSTARRLLGTSPAPLLILTRRADAEGDRVAATAGLAGQAAG